MLSSSIGMNEDVLSKKLNELITLLEEMESQGIDLVDLENNTHEQIESLSYHARKMYVDYESQYKDLSQEEILKDILPIQNIKFEKTPEISLMRSGGIYISNQVVEQINKVTGLTGGFFSVAAALIKLNLALSPTGLSLLIVAIVAGGVAIINTCNWNNKGFDFYTEFIGNNATPVGNIYCVPR